MMQVRRLVIERRSVYPLSQRIVGHPQVGLDQEREVGFSLNFRVAR